MSLVTIKNVEVYGIEESIYASGYAKRTLAPTEEEFKKEITEVADSLKESIANPHIKRAGILTSTPNLSGHNSFLQGIVVQFDLEVPIKVWTEAQRYHFLDFVSSMSTMHKLKDMNLDEAYDPYVDPRVVEIMKELQATYNRTKDKGDMLTLLLTNPVGMKLNARLVTNYRQLITIHEQRKNHTLPHWQEVCRWIESLPLMDTFLQNN